MAGGATLITVYGGTDYTLADEAITSPYYSYASNPQGFPTYFNYTPVVSSDGGTVPDYNGVVISDCRFLNELEAIKNAGGFLVRIVRPGSFIDEEYNKHQSESEMREISDSLFDLIITNDGSLDELREKTQRGVNYLLHNGA